jgi:hypothetical protein
MLHQLSEVTNGIVPRILYKLIYRIDIRLDSPRIIVELDFAGIVNLT